MKLELKHGKLNDSPWEYDGVYFYLRRIRIIQKSFKPVFKLKYELYNFQ